MEVDQGPAKDAMDVSTTPPNDPIYKSVYNSDSDEEERDLAQSVSLPQNLCKYPCIWQGRLALEDTYASVQLYHVSGNKALATWNLPRNLDSSSPPLNISRYESFEMSNLNSLVKKMDVDQDHCGLLALPCGYDHMDVLKNSINMIHGIMAVLEYSSMVGIAPLVEVGTRGPPAFLMYFLPVCKLATHYMKKKIPHMRKNLHDIAKLIVVIVPV